MPVKLYYGKDEYTLKQELSKIRQIALKGELSSLNRKVLSENSSKTIDLSEVIQLVETPPMLFGNLLVEIYATSLFYRGKTDNEKLLNNLVAALKDVPENVYIIFVCIIPPDTDKSIDSAKKLVKTIKEVGEVREFAPFKFYDTDKVINWILKTAKSKKIDLTTDTAACLQELAGSDLRTLDTELEKLKTYIFPETEVKKDDVKKLSQTKEDIFKVLNLWLINDRFSMLDELKKLLEKNPPQVVIAAFQTTARRWLRLKLEQDCDAVAKALGANPFFMKKEAEKIRNIKVDKVLNLRKNLSKADFQIKSGELPAQLALEMALVK